MIRALAYQNREGGAMRMHLRVALLLIAIAAVLMIGDACREEGAWGRPSADRVMSAQEAYAAVQEAAAAWSSDAYVVDAHAGCVYLGTDMPTVCDPSQLFEVGRADGTSASWSFVFGSRSNRVEAGFQVTREGVTMTRTWDLNELVQPVVPDSVLDSTAVVQAAMRFLSDPSAARSGGWPDVTIDDKRLFGVDLSYVHRDFWTVDYGPESKAGGRGVTLVMDAHTAEIVNVVETDWSAW
jgi:hypothetical protein